MRAPLRNALRKVAENSVATMDAFDRIANEVQPGLPNFGSLLRETAAMEHEKAIRAYMSGKWQPANMGQLTGVAIQELRRLKYKVPQGDVKSWKPEDQIRAMAGYYKTMFGRNWKSPSRQQALRNMLQQSPLTRGRIWKQDYNTALDPNGTPEIYAAHAARLQAPPKVTKTQPAVKAPNT